MAHLEEAVRLDPADARYHDGLGRAFRSAGDARQAFHEFDQALRLDVGTPRYQLGLAGLLMDQGRWRQAVAHLRQVERSEPGSPGVRLLLADLFKQTGDRDGMEHEYRTTILLADGTAPGELARQDLRAATCAREP